MVNISRDLQTRTDEEGEFASAITKELGLPKHIKDIKKRFLGREFEAILKRIEPTKVEIYRVTGKEELLGCQYDEQTIAIIMKTTAISTPCIELYDKNFFDQIKQAAENYEKKTGKDVNLELMY